MITSAVISPVIMNVSKKKLSFVRCCCGSCRAFTHISQVMFGHPCAVSLSYSLHTDVKNCERSGILLWIEANKLACHNFIEAGTSQETLGVVSKPLLAMTVKPS